MGYNKCSSIGLCITILVLIAGVYAFEKIDETLYLFLASHFVPPPPCPENERYSTCLGNCPSDCSTRGVCRGFGCARKGCDCRQNFVRMTPEGACEPVHGCPKPECGENESFRECGPVCEACSGTRCRLLTCDHRCYCDQGYLRDRGGKCVPEDECPQTHCHRDEELKPSGRKDEYCIRDEDEAINATETKERCYCREGYSRNTLGHCVADKFCAMTHCPPDEVHQSCPKKCDATCRTYGDASCEEDEQCFPGCFCPEGKVMDDFRKCVTLEECPPGSNPFARTSGPTSTPAMTSLGTTPSTEEDISDLSPTIPDTTLDDYEIPLGPTAIESSTSASTTEAATLQTTAATFPMPDELEGQTDDVPEDRATDVPKESKLKDKAAADSEQDQAADSEQDQAADSEPKQKHQEPEPKDQADDKANDQKLKAQAADTTWEKAAGIPKDQVLDEVKDIKPKDQASDTVKADIPKDDDAEQLGVTSIVLFQQDEDAEQLGVTSIALFPQDDDAEQLGVTSIVLFQQDDDEEQLGVTSIALFQQDDQDEEESGEELQETTTLEPKSSKKPGTEKKESTKAGKETAPMDEENE